MAEIKRTFLDPNVLQAVAATSLTSGTHTLDFGAQDGATLLIVTPETGVTVTIEKGNGIQGAGADLEIEAASAVVLESMKFKNMTGANRGRVVVSTDGAATVAAYVLARPWNKPAGTEA